MRNFRIEVGDLGAYRWSATLEENQGTKDQPEWWVVDSYEGAIGYVLKRVRDEMTKRRGCDL